MARVLVAVLLAGCILAASAKQGSFVDYLSAKKDDAKTSTVKPTSYDYAPAELLESCLRPFKVSNCEQFAEFPTDTEVEASVFPYFVNYKMSCCHNKKSYSKELNAYVAEPTPVGDCAITYKPFALVPADKRRGGGFMEVAENVRKVGRFSLQCTMNEESSDCGQPFCEKVVLTIADGDLFEVTDAIVSSTPRALEVTDGECEAVEKSKKAGKSAVRALPGLKAKKTTPVKAEYYEESESYYEEPGYSYSYLKKVQKAWVISGPVTVNSRLHNLKEIEDAWLEATVDYNAENAVAATEEEAHKAYVLDPYAFKFSFIKSKEY